MSLTDTDDIPWPEDLDGEEESPYLRRQKAVAVRRGRISRRLRWALRGTLFALAIISPVGYGGYHLVTFALTSPRFTLTSPEDVGVSGNQYVSREEILTVLGIAAPAYFGGGLNIFRLSLAEGKSRVESISWVRSATLSRSFPHRLTVRMVERAPVAFVNVNGRVKLVDEEGVLLQKPEKAAFGFPVLRGLETRGGLVEPKRRLALYLEFNRQMAEAPPSGWMVSEVDVEDAEDLKALLVQGRETIQVHFGHKDFLERYKNFLTLLPEVRKTNSAIDSVDLRYRDQLVVSPQERSDQGTVKSDK